MSRPFRFGVNLISPAPADEWRAKCRRAEQLGYDVLLVPDHLGMPAPFPALVAAAAATSGPRVGTFVLNAGFWNPALLAREVATTDALTGGRLELGLGTGYVRAEHESAGLPWGSPRERVDRLRHTVEELVRLLGSTDLPHSRLRSSGGTPTPDPVQRPRVPLMIGGGGDRMLRLAAEHADIVAFTGARSLPDGTLVPVTDEEFGERVARYAKSATGREEPAERNLLVQLVVVTDDPGAAVREWLPYFPQLSEEQVLGLPTALVGTLEEIVGRVRALRERHGITYLTVLEPNMEVFAPVMAALRDG
ncbi:LLM class F420-dependent oxidoreductase [Streptomyces sp. CRN 30]|uniref:LLM class F420-dependent oxidoreductase n=1 Tax=Streptomyces sp. CRN 30 TaxID=3075613 RepID=UPI002A80E286|nr:LLM class F420-dependent oxidoreductase [Streptomyces sp. CRN 30]